VEKSDVCKRRLIKFKKNGANPIETGEERGTICSEKRVNNVESDFPKFSTRQEKRSKAIIDSRQLRKRHLFNKGQLLIIDDQ
jgi:hypothetical protein